MRVICLFIMIVLLNSCNDKKPSISNLPKLKNSVSQKDSLRSVIIGQWGGVRAQHPSFEIKQDSIYFFGRSISCPYTLVNNNMIITMPEGNITFGNVHVNKDTIFFLDEEGSLTEGFRFKK